MKLSAPTVLLFLVSLALVIVSLIAELSSGVLPVPIEANRYWFAIGGYAVLTLGVLFRGL
jgi:hypothetical protein